MAFNLFLLLAFVAGSLAGPISVNQDPTFLSRCIAEFCPVTDLPKLGFKPNTTYRYSYEGTAMTTMKGVMMNSSSSLQTKLDVELSFFSPCQAVLSIKNPVINGISNDHITTELLTSHPMVVTMMDGLVTAVCAHPEENPTGLNLKKGIMSTIQNSLPYFDKIPLSKTIVENDVLGKCPTVYNSRVDKEVTLIDKFKDHLQCTKDSAISEAPSTSWWLRSPLPLPLLSSNSTCRQMWTTEHVLKSASCVDEKVLMPVLGSAKTIVAILRSNLTLQSTESLSVKPAFESGRLTNLAFEEIPQPKTQEVVQEVEALLTELCSNIDSELKIGAAKIVAKIISLLHRVPEESIKVILADIQSGKYCKNTKRMESVFKDAIAYINNGGAVEVMVEEVLSGKATGGRETMYTIALQLIKRPCIHSVKSVSRLFDEMKAPSSMILASGTLVKKYCKCHTNCMLEPAVINIMNKLKKHLDSSCSKTKTNEEEKMVVLTALKTIGNLAIISQPLEKSILNCVMASEADTMVRVAAAQSFRQVTCQIQPTSELVKLVLNSQIQTEVRIASYVAAIRCASFEEASLILKKLSEEPNTQVRSFVFSHMRNIQKSDAPYLRGLRYILSSLVIPTDYEKDLRMYSRNIDLSYYLPTVGVGAGIDSSIIYAPGSYIPRQYQVNFTANIFDNVINIGEFAVRMEDIEVLFEMVFGPKGFLHNKSHAQIAEEIYKIINTKGQMLKGHIEKIKKSDDDLVMNTISHILSTFKPRERQSQEPRVDTFLRLLGQEVAFNSIDGDIRHINSDTLLKNLADLAAKMVINLLDFDVDSVRLAQTDSENFIVTQQGIPLQMKLVWTTLLGFSAEGGVSMEKSSANVRNSASVAANGFIGYTLGVKSGMRLRAKVHGDAPLHFRLERREEKMVLSVDVPEVTKVYVAGEINTFTVFKMPSKEDQILSPINGSYPVLESKRCVSDTMKKLGIRICWDAAVPDYWQKDIAPFGYMRANVSLTKTIYSKNLLEVSGMWKKQPSSGRLNLQLDFPGAAEPTMGQLDMEYKNSKELKSLKLYVESVIIKRSLRVDIEPKYSKDGRKFQMAVYTGTKNEISSEDKVLTTAVGGKYTAKEISAEFELQTQNSLENYLKAHLDLDVSAKLSEHLKYVPKSIDLRKLEIDVAVPQCFRTINYIRRKSTGENQQQYQIKSMMKTLSSELYDISGVAKIEGSLEANNLNSSVEIDAKVEKSSYKAEAVLIYSRREMRSLTKISRQGDAKTIVLADLLSRKAKSSSSLWTTMAKLEVPKYKLSHSLNGTVQQEGSNEYRIKMVAKKEKEPLYEIEGPVTWIKKDDRIKEQSKLTIKDLRKSNEFQIVSKMNLSPEKSMANLDVKKNEKPVFSFDGDFTAAKDLAQLTCSVGLRVPQVIEGKMKVEKTMNNHLHMMLSGSWKPNTAQSQKIKGDASVDIPQKVAKLKLAYDTERDQSRVVMANLHYDYKIDRKYASAKGDLSLGSKKYVYDSEIMLGALSTSPESNNILKVKLVRPGGQVFLLESDCLVERDGATKKSVEVKGKFQCWGSKVYKIDSKFVYDLGEAPLKMVLRGRTDIETPQVKELIIMIDSAVNLVSKEQKLMYKMEVSGSSVSKPVTAVIDVAHDRSTKQTEVKVDIAAADLKLESKGHSRNTLHDSLDDLTLVVALQMPDTRLYQFKTEKRADKHFEISLLKNGAKLLAWEHRNEENGKWRCTLTVPSRVIEGHSKISSDEVSLSLYPHKEQNDEKYELSGHYRGSKSLFGGSSIDAGAKILYPGNDKPISIRSSLSHAETSSEGTLELDVFKNPKDKVFIHMKASKLDEKSYKVAAIFEIPTRSTNPRLIAEAGLSPKVKMFRFFLEDGSSAEPVMDCIVNYNKPSDSHAYVYASVKTPSDSVEMTAALQEHEIYHCRGGSINGTVNFNNRTMYEFASSVCAPGYIEVGVKETCENKMYIVKVGMKDPVSIKAALDLVYNSTEAFSISSVEKLENSLNLYGKHIYLPKKPIVLLGAKLWTPMMISLDAKYEVKEAHEYLDKVLKPIVHKLKDLSKKVYQVIPNEVLQQFSPLTSFSLIEDLREVKNEIVETCHKLSKELGFWPFPSFNDIKNEVSKLISGGRKIFKEITDKVEELLDSLFGWSLKEIQSIFREIDQSFKWTLKELHEAVEVILQTLREGKDAMMKVRWIRWFVEKLEGSSFWEWLMEKWDELKETFEDEIEAIENYLSGIYKHFMEELKEILDKLASFGYFKKLIKWIESWLFDHEDEMESTLVASVAKKFYSFYVDEKEVFASAQIPLSHPVSSLVAALPNIGVPHVYKLLWKKPSVIAKSLTSPYSASAKILSDKIVTFDGIVIPFLASRCQIEMTSACGIKILATKIDSKKIELAIVSDKRADVKIQFNSGTSPKVEGLKSSDKELTKPGLIVKKISPGEVQVETECLTMTMDEHEIAVEAKPWAYNKVEGLLGTHDHEKSTDVPRAAEVHYQPGSSAGSNHLSSSAAKRLLESYKKDRRCTIPSL